MTRFISLFTGAGGLDIGFEAAGYECLYASDLDADAFETLEANRGYKLARGIAAMQNAVIARDDVRNLTARAMLAPAGLKKGDVPLLVGGPPCQSWSSAGHQRGFDDPRGAVMDDSIRLADDLGVRWVVMENVRGLLTARGLDGVPGSALHHIRQQFFAFGFHTAVHLLNAADFGVPQRRVRLFVIAYRAGDAPNWPEPTHAKDVNLTCNKRWVTLRECLSNLAPLADDEIIRPSPVLEAQLRTVRPGSGLKSPGKSETTRPGGHWGYKQGAFVADLDAPARTVTASGQQDWIIDPKHGLRRLTPRECAAIQTFPGGWKFTGGRADQYRLIGNAVPPALAEAVARALHTTIKTTGNSTKPTRHPDHLLPLPERLQEAIRYTNREEARNGESRRLAPQRRRKTPIR